MYSCKMCGAAVAQDATFCSHCGQKADIYCCPSCKKELPKDAKFCSHCGASVTVPQCATCGKSIPEDAAFCVFCGQKTQPPPTAAPDHAPISKPIPQPTPVADIASASLSETDAIGTWKLTHINNCIGSQITFDQMQPIDQQYLVLMADHQGLFYDGTGREVLHTTWKMVENQVLFGNGTSGTLQSGLIVATDASNQSFYYSPTDAYSQKSQTSAQGAGTKQAQKNEELVKINDLTEVIGPKSEYYIPEFEKASRGEATSMNWPAFFLGGAFCFFRKCPDLYWKYFKRFLIVQSATILGLSVTAMIMSFMGALLTKGFILLIVAVIPWAGVLIYSLITLISCGKKFNRDYYLHCVRIKQENAPPLQSGVSILRGIFFPWLYHLAVLFICALFLTPATIATIKQNSEPESKIQDAPTSVQEAADVNAPREQDIIGYWTVQNVTMDGVSLFQSALGSQDADASEAIIFFKLLSLRFNQDSTWFFSGTGIEEEIRGTWTMNDGQIIISTDDPDAVITYDAQNQTIIMSSVGEENEMAIYFQKSMSAPAPVVEQPLYESLQNYLGEWYIYSDAVNDDAFAVTISYENNRYQFLLDAVTKGSMRSVYYECDNLVVNEELGLAYGTFIDVWNTPGDVTLDFSNGVLLVSAQPSPESQFSFDFVDAVCYRDPPTPRSEYLLPSDTEYLSENDLYALTKDELTLVRNEIYARYGCTFNNQSIQAYFNEKSWYYPYEDFAAINFDPAWFNEYEAANITLFVQYETEMGWR